MLSDAVYPAPLPLSRAAALNLLDRLEEFRDTGGTFLTFVEIPVEERIGDWRFAGVSGSLADAVRLVESFAAAMQLNDPGRPGGVLRNLLESTSDSGYDSDYEYPRETPLSVDSTHRVVLCVQYGAPYEGLGACVVEIASLAGSSFEGRAPETHFPKQWRKMAVKWVLEQGAKRFGPATTAVKAAIRAETRPDVWGNWRQRWGDYRGWEDLIPDS